MTFKSEVRKNRRGKDWYTIYITLQTSIKTDVYLFFYGFSFLNITKWDTPKQSYCFDLGWCIIKLLFYIVLYISLSVFSMFLFSSLAFLSFPHWLTYTHKVFWEDVQLPWWEWLMTPFTAQTPHNQRCWGSVSARCPVWVITPGTQLIYYPTINPAGHTCCPLQCHSTLVQRWVCQILSCNHVYYAEQSDGRKIKTYILKFYFFTQFVASLSLKIDLTCLAEHLIRLHWKSYCVVQGKVSKNTNADICI